MKEEEKNYNSSKQQWNSPEFLVLDAKRTADGDVEENFEDERYTNVLSP